MVNSMKEKYKTENKMTVKYSRREGAKGQGKPNERGREGL